jgi:hypothetical protein
MNKFPKTRVEIQDMVTAELRRFAGCEEAWGVVVVGLDAEISGATWTVSRFNRGESNAYECDRALQVIVPHYQRLYDLRRNTRLEGQLLWCRWVRRRVLRVRLKPELRFSCPGARAEILGLDPSSIA